MTQCTVCDQEINWVTYDEETARWTKRTGGWQDTTGREAVIGSHTHRPPNTWQQDLEISEALEAAGKLLPDDEAQPIWAMSHKYRARAREKGPYYCPQCGAGFFKSTICAGDVRRPDPYGPVGHRPTAAVERRNP